MSIENWDILFKEDKVESCFVESETHNLNYKSIYYKKNVKKTIIGKDLVNYS